MRLRMYILIAGQGLKFIIQHSTIISSSFLLLAIIKILEENLMEIVRVG